jgi:hypothetical protein
MESGWAESRSVGVAWVRNRWGALAGHEGVSLRAQLLAYLVALVVIFSRDPSVLLHPQFYAEDGAVWYQQAYNLGWLHSLLIPDGGYLNTLQRLGAGVALLFPLGLAPLVMNVLGMIVQALPVPVLISERCVPWGPLQMRVLIAVLYVLVPNSFEVHVVLTNSQWHWAFLMALLVFGAAARTVAGRVVDIFILLLGGFCGPFSVILLPLALVFYLVRRFRWTLVAAGALLPGALTQLYFILNTVRIAPKPLGATPMLFLRLLGGHVFIETMVGVSRYTPRLPWEIVVAAVVFGLIVLAFGSYYGGASLTLFTLFAGAVFLGGLKNPLIAGPLPLWQELLAIGGARYYFYPMLAFIWAAIWCAYKGEKWIRRAGYTVVCMLALSITRQFWIPAYKYHAIRPYAARFETMKRGEQMVIPIYPDPTVMTLVKK